MSAQTSTLDRFALGGNLPVRRLGFGSMQLPGPGVWGEPRDREAAVHVLRRAVELGVELIDTADSYGPEVAERLIAQALHPYPPELVIATKAGLLRTGPNQWHPLGRPAYLRQQCELSLRRLRLERIGLYQLHRIDPEVPLEDQVGTLAELRREGKIQHVGLSEVSVAEIERAGRVTPIASVQNRYNLVDRESEAVLDHCQTQNLGFIPWFPLATGAIARPGSALSRLAEELGSSPAQIAIAWLLQRSPVMLPIPGTASVQHLEENMAAEALQLTERQLAELDRLAG